MTKPSKILFTRRIRLELLQVMREIIKLHPLKWSSETHYIEQAIDEKNKKEAQNESN